MMNKYYIYLHRKKSDNTIFYIGKGSGTRSKRRGAFRSAWWNSIVLKHGYVIEILNDNMLEQDALELEEFLISELRPQLCNMTNGGEGISGYTHSEETKKKISNVAIKLAFCKTLHTTEAKNKAQKNRTGRNATEATKNKMSSTHIKIVGTGIGPSKKVEIQKENLVKSFNSICECSKYLGCSFQYVSKLVNSEILYKGYKIKTKR